MHQKKRFYIEDGSPGGREVGLDEAAEYFAGANPTGDKENDLAAAKRELLTPDGPLEPSQWPATMGWFHKGRRVVTVRVFTYD